MSRTRLSLACVLAVGLLLAATPAAQAVYIVTPLRISIPQRAYDVGDRVEFSIEPENDTTQEEWRNVVVSVCYSYDSAERPEGEDRPASDEATSSDSIVQECLDERVTLDGEARATYAWTLPQEVDDHNVDVWLQADDGGKIAFTYFAVGDAPPQMRAMNRIDDGGTEPAPIGEGNEPVTDGSGNQEQEKQDDNADDKTVPALGILLLAAGVMGVALALPRRK